MLESTDNTTTEIVYTLKITDNDLDTICWVGDRYCWSTVLGKYCFEEGEVELTHGEVEEIVEEFKEDTEGGHDFFPCLAPGSELSRKLGSLVTWYEREER